MINTVVFDLGGVLSDMHPLEGMRKLNFSDEAIEAFQEKIFPNVWEGCDSKVFTHEGIRNEFKANVPGYESEVDQLWDRIPAITGMKPYAMEWIRDLKSRGLKLYVLSNFGNVSFEIASQLYEFLPLMDGKLISYEVKITKPDLRIYQELFRRYEITPANAVFIDDRKINIEGALKAGMQGILFENYEQAKSQLLTMLEK